MGKPAHIPVLITPLIERAAPVTGLWLDGTFGAGGYACALLEAGAGRVIGVDQDPLAFRMAADWADAYGDRLQLVEGRFGDLDTLAGQALDGVVLDLGVSSMQIDDAARGFSFQKDGPLDMRMAQSGPTAAALIAEVAEGELADILYQYGEERASRRIARAIVAARKVAPIVTTGQLAEIVARCLPRPKPGQIHPATRSFQALRIAVNDEFGQLIAGLEAAERALKPGGFLGVVSFHSLEDRVVKRFLQARSGQGGGSRHMPETRPDPARFTDLSKGIAAGPEELAANPRARSARLRTARRTGEAAGPVDRSQLGLPKISIGGKR